MTIALCRVVSLDRGELDKIIERGLFSINGAKIRKRVNAKGSMRTSQGIMDMNMIANTSARRDPFLQKFSINLQVKAQKGRDYGMDNRFTDMA